MIGISALSDSNLRSWPFKLIVCLLLFWSIVIIAFFVRAFTWPHLGARFVADLDKAQIVVSSVWQNSPAAQAGLMPGDRFIAVISKIGDYKLTGLEAVDGRHQINSYALTNARDRAQSEIWKHIETGSFSLIREDGKSFKIIPEYSRSLLALPLKTYIGIFQSLLVLTIIGGIFAFAQSSNSVNLLAFSGFGLSINSMTNGMNGFREIVLPPVDLQILSISNYIFTLAFIYSLLALLWHVPSRISRFPFALTAIGISFVIFVVQYFQLYEFPFHPYQLPNLLPLPIAVLFSYIQWIRTRHDPLQRAALMWLMLSIYGGAMIVLLLYSVPIMADFPPLIGPEMASFSLCLIYVGIALGTLRFRLFDVHRIWWKAIAWFVGGFVVVLTDLLLIWQFNLQQPQALPLALLIAGWAYFPIRQFILSYFIGSRDINISDHVPELIDNFASAKEDGIFDGRFATFLRHTFKVQEFGKASDEAVSEASIQNNGLGLRVPNISNDGSIMLYGKSNGTQLFSLNDVQVANSFVNLIRNLRDIRHQESDEQKREKERIVRDLHDDVGGRLLSLIFRTSEKKIENDARDTLAALKESLIVVEDTEDINLQTVHPHLMDDAKSRLAEAGFTLQSQSTLSSNRQLSAREYINLKRILQELVSNIIKHGEPGDVNLCFEISETGDIEITCANNAKLEALDTIVMGRGIENIKKRLEEIGGRLTLNNKIQKPEKNIHQFRTSISIPLE